MKHKKKGRICSETDTRRAGGKRTESDWGFTSSINQITHSVRRERKREAHIGDGHSSVI